MVSWRMSLSKFVASCAALQMSLRAPCRHIKGAPGVLSRAAASGAANPSPIVGLDNFKTTSGPSTGLTIVSGSMRA